MQPMVAMERWKLASLVVLTLVVGLILGFLVERSRVHTTAGPTSTTTVPTPSADVTLLPTPSATVTPSPSPTPTATSAPTPMPTPTPTPATPAPTLAAPPTVSNGGNPVVSQSGNADGTYSVPSTLNDGWVFSYSFLCSSPGRFTVTVLDSSGQPVGADPPFAVDGSDAQGVQQFARGGTLQVRIGIQGSCQWRFNVDN